MKIATKNRRGVGGLISLVGLIAVFGIVATAFVELSLGQANLIGTTVDVNNLLIDKNNELLNFTIAGNNNVTVQNLWSKSSTINCYLLIVTEKTIDDKGCPDKKIDAGKKQNVTLSGVPNIEAGEIIFTTNLGKKCLVPVDRGYGVC